MTGVPRSGKSNQWRARKVLFNIIVPPFPSSTVHHVTCIEAWRRASKSTHQATPPSAPSRSFRPDSQDGGIVMQPWPPYNPAVNREGMRCACFAAQGEGRKIFGLVGTRGKFCAPTRIAQRTFKL